MSDSHELEDVLRRNGFVPCDIAACNCGSWHARYGLPERMQEIKDILADAEHPLCNENGNLVSRALEGLVAERDRLAAALAASPATPGALTSEAEDAARYRWLRNRLPGSAYRIAGVIYSEGGAGVDAAIDAARTASLGRVG